MNASFLRAIVRSARAAPMHGLHPRRSLDLAARGAAISVLAVWLGAGVAAAQAPALNGYFAVINQNGKVVRSSGVQGAKRQDVGRYRIDFAQAVTDCAVVASLVGSTGGQVSTQQLANSPNVIRVFTFSHNGTPANSSFAIQLTCAPEIVPPSPGQLVITEIMANPNAVDDVLGEWFEVRNVSASPISLMGLTLATASNSTTVASDVIVPPGGIIVLGRNADPVANGGVVVAYAYGDAIPLPNNNMVLTISREGVVIDAVSFPGLAAVAGKSFSLNPAAQTAIDNDTLANWCWSGSALTSGDFGTPGAVNETCL